MNNSNNVSNKSIDEIRALIRKETILNKKSLKSHTNKKISASDERKSSKAMGYVGIVIISVMFSLVLLADFPLLVGCLHKIIKKSGTR